ncbi:hypothetical protein [Roseivirga pacifica]|uniref:hypothetical protein n=1 Tax=Roseivirga pacifica TaxID=1267423 RepID=UPI0020945AA9|nr:hypothetical protein [Roseivirga pacifica]MCO6357543.1 hypothetical protein [Roseivirga pacifica]MCO6365796.1 hypothetical protein [Roseivirga pacifica]MCO6371125.1 hypothetical protein [Roseivirga pacifica]MCO6375704.1 hypothetical protein [Roseivirga pacifica]MCO6378503.1 hypothetical protein [Roseivirga pacifica]
MRSKLVLFAVLILCSPKAIHAQDQIQFTFNSTRINNSFIEEKNYSNTSPHILISTSEFRIPSPEEVPPGTHPEFGVRMVFSIENHHDLATPNPQNPLTLTYSQHEHGRDEKAHMEQFKNSSEAKKTAATGQAINASMKSKEERIKELSEKVAKGDQNALAALEALLNEELEKAEKASAGMTGNVPESPTANKPYYSLAFFLPYEDSHMEFMLDMKNGSVTITKMNEKQFEMSFTGYAELYYDDRDIDTISKLNKEAGQPNFGKVLKEKGQVSGKVVIGF